MIATKRAYEPATKTDGVRVLVDRLWPRGLRKDDAHLAEWAKELAPSDVLRRWFAHDPERFREFRTRYRRELAREPARGALAELTRRAARQKVTLVYGARDEDHNNAVVIAEEVAKRIKRRAAR
jgi:uncharacterized protein YeaO (DUF488 family)